MKTAKRVPRQTVLEFGRRERVVNRQIREKSAGKEVLRGPGRPKSGRDVTPHGKREAFAATTAVHVTLGFTKKVPNLRSRKKYNLVKRAFAAFAFVSRSVTRVSSDLETRLRIEKADKEKQSGFRLIHFAVLGNHLHLLCEADSSEWLTKGMQKLTVSLARLLNVDGVRAQGGSLNPRAGSFRERAGWIGKIFDERYHAHCLTSEREMSHALEYLFDNAKQHYDRIEGASFKVRTAAGKLQTVVIDIYTSFAELHSAASATKVTEATKAPPPIARARGFLLKRAMRATTWAVRHEV